MANITNRCSSEEVIRQKLRLEEAQAGLLKPLDITNPD